MREVDQMDARSEETAMQDEKVLGMCTCEGCPTWFECGESMGYCLQSVGRSECIEDELACICKACPAYRELGLTEWYYCTRDSEAVQRGT